MSTTYTQPDYCPVCHDGEWVDRDNCDHCAYGGYICPVDGGILYVEDYAGSEYFVCLACGWVSEEI